MPFPLGVPSDFVYARPVVLHAFGFKTPGRLEIGDINCEQLSRGGSEVQHATRNSRRGIQSTGKILRR
jgi:hypothetical protein